MSTAGKTPGVLFPELDPNSVSKEKNMENKIRKVLGRKKLGAVLIILHLGM